MLKRVTLCGWILIRELCSGKIEKFVFIILSFNGSGDGFATIALSFF